LMLKRADVSAVVAADAGTPPMRNNRHDPRTASTQVAAKFLRLPGDAKSWSAKEFPRAAT
jgi:hypothetical protein